MDINMNLGKIDYYSNSIKRTLCVEGSVFWHVGMTFAGTETGMSRKGSESNGCQRRCFQKAVLWIVNASVSITHILYGKTLYDIPETFQIKN